MYRLKVKSGQRSKGNGERIRAERSTVLDTKGTVLYRKKDYETESTSPGSRGALPPPLQARAALNDLTGGLFLATEVHESTDCTQIVILEY